MKKPAPTLLYLLFGNLLMTACVLMVLHFTLLKPMSVQHADAYLSEDLKVTAAALNGRFDEKMNALEGLKSYIETTLDPTVLRYNDAKLTAYADALEPHLFQMAFGFEDAYVVFLKSYFGYYHDRWYFDSNHDGVPEKMKELPESYFNGDQTTKAWYYKPLSVKRPIWIGPYESSALKGTYFITYTTLIQKAGEPVMLIGIDFEFTDFQNQISKYSKIPSAHLYLLNDSKQVIVSSQETESAIADTHRQQDTLLFESEIASQQVLKSGEFEYKDAQNQSRLGQFIPLNNGWYLGITVNRDILMASMNPQIQWIYIICLIWSLASTGLCLFIYKKVTMELNQAHAQALRLWSEELSALKSNSTLEQTLQEQNAAHKIMVLEKELMQLETRSKLHESNERALKERVYSLSSLYPLSSQTLKTTFATDDSHLTTFSIKNLLSKVAEFYSAAYPDYQCQLMIALEQDFYVHGRLECYHALFSALFELSYNAHFEPFNPYFIKVTLAHPKGFLNMSFEDNGILMPAPTGTSTNYDRDSEVLSLEDIDFPLYLLHDLVVIQLLGGLQVTSDSNRNRINIQIPV